jgi:hypothetical protein
VACASDAAAIAGGARRDKRKVAIGAPAAVAGVTAIDVLGAKQCTSSEEAAPPMEHTESSLLIGRAP